MDAEQPRDRQSAIRELRATVAPMERTVVASDAGSISLCRDIDRALPGVGLARAAFHEVLAAEPGAAIGFSSVVLGRTGGAVIWIAAEPDIWPAGVVDYGLSQTNLIFVNAKRSKDALWAFEEALRSPGITGAALAFEGPAPDLVASRRLQLAAETGGGIGLLILPGTELVPPSASRSRWRIGAASTGRSSNPSWHLALVRASGGRPGAWTVNWDRERLELAATDGHSRTQTQAGHGTT